MRQVRSEHGSRRLPPRSPWTLPQAVEFDPPPQGERLPPLVSIEELKTKSKVPAEAILKVIGGGKVVDVAREYGIPRQTLADRVRRAVEETSPAAEPHANAMDNPDGEERGGCD